MGLKGKWLAVFMAAALPVTAAGCSQGKTIPEPDPGPQSSVRTEESLENTTAVAVTEQTDGETTMQSVPAESTETEGEPDYTTTTSHSREETASPRLTAGGYAVEFVKGDEGYAVRLLELAKLSAPEAAATEASIMYEAEWPVEISVVPQSNRSETAFPAAYKSVKRISGGYSCQAEVVTDEGSVFAVRDVYMAGSAETIKISRIVGVKAKRGSDYGFSSRLFFADAHPAEDYTGYEYFIPSVLYKDTTYMQTHNQQAAGAVGSVLDDSQMFVKETRTGTPMAMARNTASGASLAVVHLNPQISAGGVDVSAKAGMVEEKLQYGSIGYDFTGAPAVGYIYPSSEGPLSYDLGTWSSVYHPVKSGFTHTYDLLLVPGHSESYQDEMVHTFQTAYTEYTFTVDPMDNKAFYDATMKIYDSLYVEYSSPSAKAAGLPFDISVRTAQPFSPISFFMGFSGAQVPAGAQMLRAGYTMNNADLRRKGSAILDFWSSDVIHAGKVPIVWWDPANDSGNAGKQHPYPSFLRVFVDGMEALLDGYVTAAKHGEEKAAWKRAFMKTADFLVGSQNSDGSFYRAYNLDGSVNMDKTNVTIQGDSRLNTPIVIRFLGKVYELTGDQKYKTAALRAAQFSYDKLYREIGKYIGGTTDNPNTADKEAAIYALYGFSAAYELSGDSKYLKALEHAAVSVMSWTITYDYAVTHSKSIAYDQVNPFKEGHVKGLGFIATGHSSFDSFAAVASYELFKQYVRTGTPLYKQFACLLQNNTKMASNYNGSQGWAYNAFMIEAITAADFLFSTAGDGVWLPWISVSYVSPANSLQDTFGAMDLYELDKTPREKLNAQMKSYGLGGTIKK